MPVLERTGEGRTVTFNFPTPEELAPPLLTSLGVNLGYTPQKTILKKVDLRLDQDDRIALLGANGNGKSTLVKFLAGVLPEQGGDVYRSGKLRVGYYDQYQSETLNLDDTPYNVMADYMRSHKAVVTESVVRAKLGQFHFSKEHMDGKIRNLSGGERARLLFALISYNAPNILLLDEPTNHLDLASREALVQALNDYQGAVVLVSHDPSLIERVADRLWLVADGKVQDFNGDLNDYRDYVLEQRRQTRRASSKAKAEAALEVEVEVEEAPAKKVVTLSPGQRRKRFPQLFAAAQTAEKTLSTLTAEKTACETALQDPTTHSNPAKIKELQQQLKALQPKLAAAEAAWLEAQSAYDNAV
jgi:ATP-binding cassette subfamily F protein 3